MVLESDDEIFSQDRIQNLNQVPPPLLNPEVLPGQGQELGMDITSVIDNALKHQIAPLVQELKKLQKEVLGSNKKITELKNQVALMAVTQKEIANNMDKTKLPLTALLTTEGVELLKTTSLENLQLVAKDEENDAVFNLLMQEFRENDHLLKDSAKSQATLKMYFNEERSTLKQQVVERIRRDITNSSPESGSNLHLTRSYLASHIGRLSDKCVNVIYQLAYLHAKYLNKKVTLVETADKSMRSKLQKNLWGVLFKRVSRDDTTEDDLKVKLRGVLTAGYQKLQKDK